MVNDLNHTHRKNPKLAFPNPKSQDNFSDTLNLFSYDQTPSINNKKGNTSLHLSIQKQIPNKNKVLTNFV